MFRSALLGYLFFISLQVSAQLTGKVIAISDGDTFTMLVNHKPVKIRLHGIDCPEKNQAYGAAAKKYLSDLIFNQVVVVQVKGKDRYRRTIGIVTVKNIIINEKMLQAGLAWHYKKYDAQPSWAHLEAAARNKKVGLWAHDHPIPPWEFRKPKRKAF